MKLFLSKTAFFTMLLCTSLFADEAASRTPKGVVIPNAMSLTFNKYVACIDQNTDISGVKNQGDLKIAVDKALAACKIQRIDLIHEAEAAMKADPAYPDATSRSRVVINAFNTEDAIRLAMGEGRILYEDE